MGKAFVIMIRNSDTKIFGMRIESEQMSDGFHCIDNAIAVLESINHPILGSVQSNVAFMYCTKSSENFQVQFAQASCTAMGGIPLARAARFSCSSSHTFLAFTIIVT